MRIARTVTGRNTIAIFTGSYHGIFDEVIVRGTKKLRAVPAAPGIMPVNVAERPRARLRHARDAGDHPRSAPTSSPPCWSSRCRAGAPISSRASS